MQCREWVVGTEKQRDTEELEKDAETCEKGRGQAGKQAQDIGF